MYYKKCPHCGKKILDICTREDDTVEDLIMDGMLTSDKKIWRK